MRYASSIVTMTQHLAWDFGALTGLFGVLLKQKTVKTVCGKTVKFAHAGAIVADTTCSECLRINSERDAFLNSLGISK